jgi:hypothetical protein
MFIDNASGNVGAGGVNIVADNWKHLRSGKEGVIDQTRWV